MEYVRCDPTASPPAVKQSPKPAADRTTAFLPAQPRGLECLDLPANDGGVAGAPGLVAPAAVGALTALDVDEYGLDEMDKDIILATIEKFKGGPVGLSTLAVAVNEDPGTIEEVYEPFLIQQGFIQRTPRGREATDLAYIRFGIKRRKTDGTADLFDQGIK